jgi:hypothetical protein
MAERYIFVLNFGWCVVKQRIFVVRSPFTDHPFLCTSLLNPSIQFPLGRMENLKGKLAVTSRFKRVKHLVSHVQQFRRELVMHVPIQCSEDMKEECTFQGKLILQRMSLAMKKKAGTGLIAKLRVIMSERVLKELLQ